jgi:hypothetical protein
MSNIPQSKKRMPSANAIAKREAQKAENAAWREFLRCPVRTAKWHSGIHDSHAFEFALEKRENLDWQVYRIEMLLNHLIKRGERLSKLSTTVPPPEVKIDFDHHECALKGVARVAGELSAVLQHCCTELTIANAEHIAWQLDTSDRFPPPGLPVGKAPRGAIDNTVKRQRV